MSERGEALGVGPTACPFVALELDRDKRSDKPDYRHRCFAEPTPQPRAISHQAAFCLSPNFSGCPIFQDWAVRASAQPVATVGGGPPAGADAAAGGAAAIGRVAAAAVTDIPPELPAPGETWPSEAFPPAEEPDAAEQLSVFAAGAAEPAANAPAAPPTTPQPDAGRFFSSEPPEPVRSAPIGALGQPEEAPVPGFLAGRPARPARSSRPPELEPVSREELIPSWERDGRFGAEPAERERTDRFGGIVTAIAVIAILGLGVAGVIFLPGLLAGGGGPARTATPGLTAGPSDGAVLPTAIVTPVATFTSSPTPGVSAAPTPTPHIYRVRKGDSMAGIARKFHISMNELLAANPQITNPDHIEPGDLLTIPPPGGSEPSATP